MTTTPYVSGASYILRMSDYCDGCAFDPKGNCPFTNLYWAFLARVKKDHQRVHLPHEKEKKWVRVFVPEITGATFVAWRAASEAAGR
jgi:deoxyribodipyrimidine photolyase-like uncharacterized protein